MWEMIAQDEYEQFLEEIKSPSSLLFGRYIDEYAYEDEFSHNEIHEAQNMFMKKVKSYIHDNCPGKYVVTCSYCVMIMTIDYAEKLHMSKEKIESLTIY